MGLPPTPQEAAPAYEELFEDHPVNQFRPTGSSSAVGLQYSHIYMQRMSNMQKYAQVPQADIELQAHEHNHNHTSPSPGPPQAPESLAQTIAGVFRPRPHTHCEQCDVQLAAREKRANQRHCCTMVAVMFMIAFFCMLLLGIVVTSAVTKAKRHGH